MQDFELPFMASRVTLSQDMSIMLIKESPLHQLPGNYLMHAWIEDEHHIIVVRQLVM